MSINQIEQSVVHVVDVMSKWISRVKINEFYVIQIHINISMLTWFFNDVFKKFMWKLFFCENNLIVKPKNNSTTNLTCN